MEWAKKEVSPITALKQVGHLRAFIKRMPESFTLDDIKRALKAIPNQNNRSNKGKALRRFLRDYLKLIDEDEAKEIPIEQPPVNFAPVPSDEDVAAFIYALPTDVARAFYLIIASGGLRRYEARNIRRGDIDLKLGVIKPRKLNDQTKRAYYWLINQEAIEALLKIQPLNYNPEDRVFPYGSDHFYVDAAKMAEDATGLHITPQDLRRWHADKLDRLGMKEKYIEFLQGKTPKTTLRRHYSDYTIEKVKAIYDQAGLKVLS
jgi:integrase